MVATGNVVEEFNIGKTRIRICDDCCREKTEAEVEEILKRIAKNAIGPLTVAAAQSARTSTTEESEILYRAAAPEMEMSM